MALYQTLKYGTRVLVGLAVTGALIYTHDRNQIKVIDFIELFEGTRERELITEGVIAYTNTLSLQVATNHAAVIALQGKIIDLIPRFVNQTRITEWLAGTSNAPPRWTLGEVKAQLNVKLDPIPVQVRKSDLIEMHSVLTLLVYTDDSSSWSTNRIQSSSKSETIEYSQLSTNYDYGGPYNFRQCANWSDEWSIVLANEPGWFSHHISDVYAEIPDCPTNAATSTGYGQPPSLNWSASLDILAYNIREDDTWYSGYWRAVYEINKWVTGDSEASLVASKMKGTAYSVEVPRIDHYYYIHDPFETVNCGTNQPYSVTSGYCEIDDLSMAGVDFYAEVDVRDPPDYGCTGYYVTSINGSSTNDITGNLSSSGGRTNDLIRNVIHEWKVTRCAP